MAGITMQTTFQDLGVSESILSALASKGYESPTPIQAAVIPRLLTTHKDIMAQARTGTGKTAAFGIPIVQNCTSERKVQALVLAPTRELAMQVCKEMESMKGDAKMHFALLYGGQGMAQQIKALQSGVSIVVGTPGRVLDHIRAGRLHLDQLRYLVLDEADRMLDMGFQEELEAIVASANPDRQTLLFSATFAGTILRAAEVYLKDYDRVSVESVQEPRNTRMLAHEVYARDKREALRRVLTNSTDFYGLIFCARKSDVDELADYLSKKGFRAEGLHGDMSQPAREKVLGRLRKRKLSILVATDVAARGIDVNDLGFVIHYDIPDSADALTHRTGRTARAGKTGTSICLFTPSEASKFRALEKRTGLMHERTAVPDRAVVQQMARESVRQGINKWLERSPGAEYSDFAGQLLESYDAQDLLAVLLRDRHGDLLLDSAWPDIAASKPSAPSEKGKNGKNGKSGGGGFRSARKAANRKRKYGPREDGSVPNRRGGFKKSGAGRK
ncbi:MAG: DEAD/DEAH box helicase [Leptospiraceae bacterium]|nr:DEAD/DEAH box helicase [Leptospiraceae bacterium]